MSERIRRGIGRRNAVQHGTKKKGAAPFVIVFVKNQGHFGAATETAPRLGAEMSHHFAAGHLSHSLDQLLMVMVVRRTIEPQYLFQGDQAVLVLRQRQVVER